MKELSIEEKAKAYDKVREKIALRFGSNVADEIFSQFEMSEDERIRKELIDYCKNRAEKYPNDPKYKNISAWLAWLEKQSQELRKVSIWKHWKDGIAGNGEGKSIYLIKVGNTYSLSSCLGFECDYIELSELDNLMLEKQGEQKQDPCENCKNKYLNCHNFPCIEKRAFEQGKSVWEAIKEEKVDNQNCIKPVEEPFDKYEGLTDFERTLADICIGWIGEEFGWKQYIKDNADVLLKIAIEKFNSVQDVPFDQKPVDKVEPKFNVGDWTVSNLDGKARQISEVHFDEYNSYYVVNGMPVNLEEFDRRHHLWTIEDAKGGDVLACENGWTCIFKTLVNDETFSSYCFMDNTKWFCGTGSEGHTLKEEFVKAYNGEIYPATKEQRDTLMKAMTDAGYTFDFEKKKLKEIEQKSAWSEEDEKRIKKVIHILSLDGRINNEELKSILDWLKSLKERVQPKQEWSEEDIRNIDDIDSVLFYDKDLPEDTCMRLRNWLESLKQRLRE